jgi:hypothetical protein
MDLFYHRPGLDAIIAAMDIRAGIFTTIVLAVMAALIFFRGGIRSIQSARKLTFYRLRRQRMSRGWRMLFTGVLTIVLRGLAGTFRGAHRLPVFSTLADRLADTDHQPGAQHYPVANHHADADHHGHAVRDRYALDYAHAVHPAGDRGVVRKPGHAQPGCGFQPLAVFDGVREFRMCGPIHQLCQSDQEMWACFSYNNMFPGVQWTALWYRNGELVHYETVPWDGTTGGLGYSEWAPPRDVGTGHLRCPDLRRFGLESGRSIHRLRRPPDAFANGQPDSDRLANLHPYSLRYPDFQQDAGPNRYGDRHAHPAADRHPDRYAYAPAGHSHSIR